MSRLLALRPPAGPSDTGVWEADQRTAIALALSKTDLVAMLVAYGGSVRVPLRCWPLEVALEKLAATTPAGSSLAVALGAWPPRKTPSGCVRPGVDGLLIALAGAGVMSAEGAGWEAGFRLSPAARKQYQEVIAALSLDDREALRSATQVLVACLTTWSKNAVEAGPISASTS